MFYPETRFSENNRKKILLFTITLFFCFLSISRGSSKIRASVSIPPVKYLIKQIGKQHLQVTVMVGPGSNPATYEPKSSQVANLSSTELYFAIGVPFEDSWLPRFNEVNKDMRVIHLDRQIHKRYLAKEYQGSEQDIQNKELGKDPHIWLSPILMRIMAGKVLRVLAKADPTHKSQYRQNYLDFSREIDRLDLKILDVFSQKQIQENMFMTFHPAWGYLAREYGLKQIPIELEGKSPGPREMGKLIKRARKLNIRTIFVQPQFSQKEAQTIAKGIGARVKSLNPLARDWEENLLEMSRKIAQSLKK